MKNFFLLWLIVTPFFVRGQSFGDEVPNGGILVENSFSRGADFQSYHNFGAGFFAFFPLNGKPFQPWIPFLRTEFNLGTRKGNYVNNDTREFENVNSSFAAISVILPVRWPLAEGVFCNTGIGVQGGVARNSVFSTDTNPYRLQRASTDPHFGVLVDINISFGQKTNAFVGTRLMGSFSAFDFLVSSFYIAYSIPNLSPKKPG
jgi:hypothetical protein